MAKSSADCRQLFKSCGKPCAFGFRELCQYRERTGVPARAACVRWWMRPDQPRNLNCDPVATAPGTDTQRRRFLMKEQTTQEANKALIRRWFEEVWNKGRAEAVSEMMSEDCVNHGLS